MVFQYGLLGIRNDIEMLEVQKAKSTNDILKLNRIIDEFQETLAQKKGRGEPGARKVRQHRELVCYRVSRT